MVARPLRRLKLAEYNNNLLFSRARCSPMPWPAVEGFCRALATRLSGDRRRQTATSRNPHPTHHPSQTRWLSRGMPKRRPNRQFGRGSLHLHPPLLDLQVSQEATHSRRHNESRRPTDGRARCQPSPRPILGGRLGLAIAGEHRTTGLVLDEAVPRGPYEFPNLLHGPDRQHIS